jgi:nucleoside-diphosphate-sugar epimerase
MRLVRELDATSLMTVPTIMEEILSLDDFDHAASALSTLDFVAVGGGGMKSATGQQFHSRGVKLLNHFGATEIGALAPIFRPGSDYDFRYLKVRSDMGLKIVSLDPAVYGEGACKIVGHPFGWGSAFELQDRLERNPMQRDSQVRILGRNDDFIVLATGEKVVPHLLEQALQQDPRVRFAVAFGTGQAQIGVLVEPQSNFASAEAFVEDIWPIIERINPLLDGHAQIPTKSAVLIKPADKVIPLSDKGVPQRKEVYTAFADEIDSVYRALEEGRSDGLASNIDFDRIEDSIRMLVGGCMLSYSTALDFSNDDDFINMGMDSLQATRLRRSLSASLRRQGHILVQGGDLPLDFVYRHASVSRLAKALSDPEAAPEAHLTMIDLLSKYSFSQASSNVSSRGATILVTGSTGNLGAHLLDSLSRNQRVNRVICLIRSNTPALHDSTTDALKRRQQNSLDQRGFALPEEAWSKLAFLPWKPHEQHLGLSREQYEILSREVTDIFHGAWPMDFKRTLLSLEPQIGALRDLLKLGEAIHQNQPSLRPKVIFASSIATVGCLDSEHRMSEIVTEKLYSAESTLPMGYAEGKWVCERVMESVYENSLGSVHPMVLRIGQLAGSEATGYWSSQEHIAALVKVSQGLGRMPDLQGVRSTFTNCSLGLTRHSNI